MCFTLNAATTCTPVVTDSYTPRWTTMNRFPATAASALMAGVQMTYADDDFGPDDTICAGPIHFAAADFMTMGTRITCGAQGFFDLTLTPAP